MLHFLNIPLPLQIVPTAKGQVFKYIISPMGGLLQSNHHIQSPGHHGLEAILQFKGHLVHFKTSHGLLQSKHHSGFQSLLGDTRPSLNCDSFKNENCVTFVQHTSLHSLNIPHYIVSTYHVTLFQHTMLHCFNIQWYRTWYPE